jgi:hypothetical protein
MRVIEATQQAKDDLDRFKTKVKAPDTTSPCSEPALVMARDDLAEEAEHYRDLYGRGHHGPTLVALRERRWAPASPVELAAAIQVLADELWAVMAHVQGQVPHA